MTMKFTGAKKAEAMRAERAKRQAAAKRHSDKQARLTKRNTRLYSKLESCKSDEKAKPVHRLKTSAAERIDAVMTSKAQCRKELTKLYALVAKLTASRENDNPKVLFIDEKELAARWGMSVKHIRNLRGAGVGPLVTYFGRSVRYRMGDVRAFEKANAFASRTAKEQAKKG